MTLPSAVEVSVVVITRNRCEELRRSLRQLSALAERPALVVVDNASSDGTVAMVTSEFPDATLVRASRNWGAAARNLGVARVRSRYVAFSDDDCWWHDGALALAAAILDGLPGVGALAAQVLVGPDESTDSNCERMAASPIDRGGLPFPRIASFMAGAVVMRTAAYRRCGGYEPRLFLGAEEALLALDLDAAGWSIIYAPQVRLHHHPSGRRDAHERALIQDRNRLWVAWLRLPASLAVRQSLRTLHSAIAGGRLWPVLRSALSGTAWVSTRRRVLPASTTRRWAEAMLGAKRPGPQRSLAAASEESVESR